MPSLIPPVALRKQDFGGQPLPQIGSIGGQPDSIAPYGSLGRARAANAFELVLGLAYFLWMEAVLKDWLTSYVYPGYPLAASFTTSMGVIAGFVALRRVRSPGMWRDIILTGSAVLTGAGMLGILPVVLGILPSVAVLSCAMSISSLVVHGKNLSIRKQRLCIAALTVGLSALIWPRAGAPGMLAWGGIVALATLSVSWLACLIPERRNGRGRGGASGLARAGLALSLTAGFLTLSLVILGLPFFMPFTNADLAGFGLGWERPGSAILELADFSGFSVLQFSVLKAAAVLTCILIIPQLLLVRKNHAPAPARGFYAAAAIAVFAVFIYASVHLSGASQGAQPLQSPGSSPEALQEALPFAAGLAREEGLLTLAVLGITLFIAIAGSFILMSGRIEGEDRGARISLFAGAAASLYGMLLGANIGPTFLTADSSAGTWALAIAIASLGIAASQAKRPRACRESKARDGGEGKGKKTRTLAVLMCAAALGVVTLGVYCQHTLQRMIEPYAGFSPPHGYKAYVPLHSISREMLDATVAFEDPEFYSHRGFDWLSMHHALRVNLRSGLVQRGGSTITQQLAKNLFLTKERTLWRKVEEAALTVQMEWMLPKQRILEIYLNTIDYGMEQKGVEAAARYYFHMTPGELTLAESAVLAGLVPHPPRGILSQRQLAAGQSAALQRAKKRWPDRYSDSDIEKAAGTPLFKLIHLPKDFWENESAEQPPGAERQVLGRSSFSLSRWNIAALAILSIIVIYAIMSRRQRGQDSHERGGERGHAFHARLLCAIAYFSILIIFVMSWDRANSEPPRRIMEHPDPSSPAPGNYQGTPDNYGAAASLEQTERLISGLDGEIAPRASAFINYLRSQGIPAVIAEGHRSMIKQGMLYAQGRLSPGPVVTNAFFGSKHLEGMAFDIAIADIPYGAIGAENWEYIGGIGETFGLKWGGRFQVLKDFVHFEV